MTLAGISSASVANVYIAQSAAGAGDGSSCSNAKAASFFNSSANWGSGSSQIGPGSTVHVCGTFNVPGNSTALNFQGSGSSGSPVTLHGESGNSFTTTVPPNAGVIAGSGHDLVIDGINLTVTANGSGLANSTENVKGLYLSCSSRCEIKNSTVTNIYNHSSLSDNNGDDTYGAYIQLSGGGSTALIHDNTLSGAKFCAAFFPSSGAVSDVEIYNNTFTHCDHGPTVGSGNPSESIDNVLIHDNDYSDPSNWDTTSNSFHHDGVHIWMVHSSSTGTNFKVYNNYFHGNWGTHSNITAAIFQEANGGGTMNNVKIFNNVVESSDANAQNAWITWQGDNNQILNNTLTGSGTNPPNNGLGGGLYNNGGTGAIVENNIISKVARGIGVDPGATLATCDYNVIANINASNAMNYGSQYYTSVAAWKSGTGLDAHSITSSPLLSGTLQLLAGSPGVDAGTNLTSMGMSALDSDKAGASRPSSGAWDIGAYESGSSSSTAPNPPAGLAAVVN